MTQIGKSNVKWSEIRDALNKNGGSVSNKAEDAFKVSSKYQKWARWKPTKYNIDFHPSASFNKDEMWHADEEHYFGIKAPELLNTGDIDTSKNYDDLWVINPPIGKIEVSNNVFNPAEPFRLGDFAGHDLNARHPIKSINGPSWVSYVENAENDVTFHCVFNNNNNTDWLDITDFGRGVEGDILGDNFSSYYFGGVFINTENGFITTITNDKTINTTTTDSTSGNPSIYDATHCLNVSREAFKTENGVQTGKYKLYFAMFPEAVNGQGNIHVTDGFYVMPCDPFEFELGTVIEDVKVYIKSIVKTNNNYNVTIEVVNNFSSFIDLYKEYNWIMVSAKDQYSEHDYISSIKYPTSSIRLNSGESVDIVVNLSKIIGYDSPGVGTEVWIECKYSINDITDQTSNVLKIS